MRWAAKARASAAFCLAGALAGAGLCLASQALAQRSQPSAAAPCPGACVTDGSHDFDPGSPAMASAERAIATENERVRATGRYVSVALLDPLTPAAGDAAQRGTIADELRGAYLAQRAFNATRPFFSLQLLLADEGSVGQFHAQAVRQLEAAQAPDRLVAVAGLSFSTAYTADNAAALSADGMPMFGAATADQFSGERFPGFEQVTPDLQEQVITLMSVLGGPRGAVLISDQPATDLYAANERADILQEFKAGLHENLRQYVVAIPSPAVFQSTSTTPQACADPEPPAVYFAGPPVALQHFIEQLQFTPECAGRKITIVTADDGGALSPAVTRILSGPARITVEYAGMADASTLTAAFAAAYRHYAAGAGSAGLSDPFTITTYNSVIAAGDASAAVVPVGPRRNPGGVPASATAQILASLLKGKLAPMGASGPFRLSAAGQLVDPDIPVYADSGGTRKLVRP